LILSPYFSFLYHILLERLSFIRTNFGLTLTPLLFKGSLNAEEFSAKSKLNGDIGSTKLSVTFFKVFLDFHPVWKILYNL